MSKSRITWVDIAKYLGIMCVMNSHLESAPDRLEMFYTPFFLMIFFFTSGYVYRHTDNFGKFLKKKIFQLFVPWLLFSVLNILLSQVLSFNSHSSLKEELFWNFMQVRGYGDGLWFISALFITFIPFFFFIKWYEKSASNSKHWILIGSTLALSVASQIYFYAMNPSVFPWKSTALPWHLEYIFVAMFFMILGYLFRTKFEELFDRYNTWLFKLVVLGLFLGTVFISNYVIHNDFANLPITYLSQLSGVTFIVALCKILPSTRIILYLGQNTLLCFALHGKIYSVLETIIDKLVPNLYYSILSNVVTSSLFSILLTIVLSIILIIPIWIINRWFPFTIGRKRISKK